VKPVETNLHPVGQAKAAGLRAERRRGSRKAMGLPGRIIWRDSRGTPRFSSIVTRDVGDRCTYVECLSGPPIPMHRLVFLQLDRTMSRHEFLPAALRQGKILSAVCRIGPVSNVTGLPDGYALRLLVDPADHAVPVAESSAFAAISLAVPA
jgi:hypothetical protein